MEKDTIRLLIVDDDEEDRGFDPPASPEKGEDFSSTHNVL